MASEFDDLFDSSEILHSEGMTKGKGRLVESETILDRLFGSPFPSIEVHSGVSNVDALVKVFGPESKTPARTPPPTNTPGREPEPYPADPLSKLMQESDQHVGRELLKRAPAQPRSESKHFIPIVKIAAQLRTDLRKKGFRADDAMTNEAFANVVRSAMDLVSEAVAA